MIYTILLAISLYCVTFAQNNTTIGTLETLETLETIETLNSTAISDTAMFQPDIIEMNITLSDNMTELDNGTLTRSFGNPMVMSTDQIDVDDPQGVLTRLTGSTGL